MVIVQLYSAIQGRLNIETGRHKEMPREDSHGMCAVSGLSTLIIPGLAHFDAFESDDKQPDPVEDEQHAIFDCPGYASSGHIFHDCDARVSTVAQFLPPPDCNRIAKFLPGSAAVACICRIDLEIEDLLRRPGRHASR